MKILHTMDTGGLYGKERMLLALIKKQVSEGHQVAVFGFGENDFYHEACQLTMPVARIESVGIFQTMLKKTGEEYDVIHTHDYKTGILVALWHIAHPNVRVIRTLHGFTGHDKPWYSKHGLTERLDKFMLRFNSCNVGVSQDLADEHNAHLIYNGVEAVSASADASALRKDILEFCERGVIYCCMARLSPEKNLETLIEAIRVTDNAKLLLFGDGPEREKLEKLVEWNPDKVMFAGFDKNSRQYLPYVDVYVQPSLTEGMPISVLEAMSAGVPLLLTDVGGMKVLHRAEVAAMLPTKMMNTIMHMTTMAIIGYKDWVKRKTVKGKELFEKRFSVDAMYGEYNKLYTETQ